MIVWDRLRGYPALSAFSPAEAHRRLEAYEREERRSRGLWLTVGRRIMWALLAVLILWAFRDAVFLTLYLAAFAVESQVVQHVTHRRIRRRVAAKVAAALRSGRLETCLDCSYDLRGSPGPRCPECGANILTPGPPKPLWGG